MTESYEKRVGILFDVHHPFASKAYKVAVQYLKTQRLTELILGGDFCDFYKISRFVKKEHQRMTFADELALVRAELTKLREDFPDIPIQYIVGNHEIRYQDLIFNKAEELFGIREITLEKILGLKELKIKLVDNKARLVSGKLPIVRGGYVICHGPDVVKAGSAVNLGRSYLLKTWSNVIFGHHHTEQEYAVRKLSGGYLRAYSSGCLCDLNVEFSPHNNWSHSFMILHYNSKNRVDVGHVRQIRIDEKFKILE